MATTSLPQSPGHPFYQKLNRLLAEPKFDEYIEGLCRPYYADGVGRPGIPPGVYFRMWFVGYFEGLDSQRARGVAMTVVRCRQFWGIRSRIRRRIIRR